MTHPRSLPSPGKALFKVCALVSILFLSIWILSLFPDLTLAFILSGLAAFAVSPIVRVLESRIGMRRVPAVVTTFFATTALLALAFLRIGPMLVARLREIHGRFRDFPFEEKLTDLSNGLAITFPFLDGPSVARSIQNIIGQFVEHAAAGAEKAIGTILTMTLIPFLMYFILADGRHVYTSLIGQVPNRYFEMTLNVVSKIQRQLVNYLRGWILDSMIVGALTIVGLSILGISYAVIIGLIAGVANLVPYLGPLVAATLAILVSLTQHGDLRMVGPILIMTLIIRLTDDFIVQPTCFARSINMHPLTVLLLLIIGHEAFGIMGMLLAIPLATIIKVSAVETYWGLTHYRITA